MKAKDEQQWILFQQYVRDKGNPGMKKLLEIFIRWTDAVQAYGDLGTYNLALLDQQEFAILSAMDVGELFFMACQFWPDSEEFAQSLTPLESMIVRENFTVKILAQQEEARKAGEKAEKGADAPI
jgi:hypothetical protein